MKTICFNFTLHILKVPHHALEKPLEPSTQYLWTVRAYFPRGGELDLWGCCPALVVATTTSNKSEVEILRLQKSKESQDWVDPIVGGRFTVGLTEKISFRVRGDIGGFGIGSAFDFAWNVVAVLGYQRFLSGSEEGEG